MKNLLKALRSLLTDTDLVSRVQKLEEGHEDIRHEVDSHVAKRVTDLRIDVEELKKGAKGDLSRRGGRPCAKFCTRPMIMNH